MDSRIAYRSIPDTCRRGAGITRIVYCWPKERRASIVRAQGSRLRCPVSWTAAVLIAAAATASCSAPQTHSSPEGSLDGAFGTGGVVSTDLKSHVDRAQGVAVQPDGKIVAVGASNIALRDTFAVVRYLP